MIVIVPLKVSIVILALICTTIFRNVKLIVRNRELSKFPFKICNTNCNVACNCDPNGSTSLICQKSDGQCPCKDNVGGRQCNACEDGFKEHPNCIGKTVSTYTYDCFIG